jgi:hypothetical protein
MQEQKYFSYPFSFNQLNKEKKQKPGRKPGRYKTFNYIDMIYASTNNDHADKGREMMGA